jgi:DNA-binding protein HU-beta
MNKAELVSAVHGSGNFGSRAAAAKAVEAVLGAVSTGIKKDGRVQIVGFGTFSVKSRGARTGRNPRTGASIKISASKSVGFKAGKALKDRL